MTHSKVKLLIIFLEAVIFTWKKNKFEKYNALTEDYREVFKNK